MGNGVPQSAGNGGRGDEIGAAVKDESGNGDPLGQYMPTEKVPPSARGQIMDVPANQQVDRSSGRHRHAFGKPVLERHEELRGLAIGIEPGKFLELQRRLHRVDHRKERLKDRNGYLAEGTAGDSISRCARAAPPARNMARMPPATPSGEEKSQGAPIVTSADTSSGRRAARPAASVPPMQ